jgi:cystathionine beta-lyase/cystathionine gamma-synthase
MPFSPGNGRVSSITAMDFETRAIHAGQEPDPATGAISTPIYQTSTYVQEAVGVHKGYDYARVANPTRTALQVALASLENATHGVAFSSGLGATTTLMHLVNPGQRVVLIADVYGGVYRMTSKVYEEKGYRFTYVPASEFDDNLPAHLDEDVRLVWVESPSNPLLNVVDIRRAAEAAHAVGALLVVDNTFATPYLQQPLDLGADAVVHSTTKYLGGHSDVIGGFVATSDDALAERLYFLQKSLGAVPGPFDAWLVLRGLKTLAVRMRQHCENARRVAEFLDGHDGVEKVLYPGLPSHPGHDVARAQMRDFGGMISFLLESEDEAVAIVARTKLFKLAESLGGVESMIEHPARMTHASTADAPFAPPGNLVRLSVGIESADDLVADLEAALVRRAATV